MYGPESEMTETRHLIDYQVRSRRHHPCLPISRASLCTRLLPHNHTPFSLHRASRFMRQAANSSKPLLSSAFLLRTEVKPLVAHSAPAVQLDHLYSQLVYYFSYGTRPSHFNAFFGPISPPLHRSFSSSRPSFYHSVPTPFSPLVYLFFCPFNSLVFQIGHRTLRFLEGQLFTASPCSSIFRVKSDPRSRPN
jgi:hypothetical protein